MDDKRTYLLYILYTYTSMPPPPPCVLLCSILFYPVLFWGRELGYIYIVTVDRQAGRQVGREPGREGRKKGRKEGRGKKKKKKKEVRYDMYIQYVQYSTLLYSTWGNVSQSSTSYGISTLYPLVVVPTT